MTTYNPSIPQPTDLISNSQAQLLANFGQLNTQFGVDHVAFNTGSGNGDGTHKKITFDNAPSEPTPTGTISNIFPLLVGSNQELFFKNASTEYNGSGKIQLTGASSLSANGSVTLQCGVVLKWGTVTLAGTGTSQTVTFPTAFPANCWAVNAIKTDTVSTATLSLTTNFVAASFQAVKSSGSSTLQITYVAIGN